MSYLDNIDTDPDFEPPEKKKMKTCVSQDLSMALDRGGISNAKATMIIAATASSLGHPIEELNLSVSTIRRARMKIRKCVANEMKASFSSDDYWVVHWDGKLLPDLTDGGSGQLVDRLPVIISGKVTEQLLGAPKIETGTGASQAEAVYKCLVDWGVQDNVVGMCFDTTSSNTGHKSGACTLVERKLGRPLMNLACRHHVLELVLKAAFEDQFGTSTSPQIPMFEKFRREWHALDHKNITMEQISAQMSNLTQMMQQLMERQDQQQLAINSLSLNQPNVAATPQQNRGTMEDFFKLPDPIKVIPKFDGSRKQLTAWLTTVENTLEILNP
ncbi:uncharacterized protein LOC134206943 [Armigeres subalbatus]|uniref:uncharacterized protein LOC134206943 n=1 Tax=Armigeres subalbatus TaxID=124917 RepID=UPI002ED50AC3